MFSLCVCVCFATDSLTFLITSIIVHTQTELRYRSKPRPSYAISLAICSVDLAFGSWSIRNLIGLGWIALHWEQPIRSNIYAELITPCTDR